MSIRAGVDGAAALRQADNAPHAEAGAEDNNESLQDHVPLSAKISGVTGAFIHKSIRV